MKKLYFLASFTMVVIGLLVGMTACGSGSGDDDGPATPKVSINVRSCTISSGTEYVASELKEVTVSYNNVVAVSPSANITLNDVKCSAKSSSKTSMDVVISLPALEEGKTYTLTIPEGAIVSKEDNSIHAPAYSVTFTTKEGVKPISNEATELAKRLGWGWNLGNHFDTSSAEHGNMGDRGRLHGRGQAKRGMGRGSRAQCHPQLAPR